MMLTTRTYRGGKEGGTGCGVAPHVKAGEYLEVTTHDDPERMWIPQGDRRYFKPLQTPRPRPDPRLSHPQVR